ncbi:hypothetical protein RUM43_008472 [Polyplax serrata]|uniref:Uncharacterized protein n=1 Tax=Polyplax serrata TaxID=468196 RepID=A0AAN8NMN6_POLSC
MSETLSVVHLVQKGLGALHMKEHPDYKYRPRRKPKTLVKKDTKFGFSISPILSPNVDSIQRSLLPPPPSSGPPPPSFSILDEDPLKFSRSIFPPFTYPLYHSARLRAEDLSAANRSVAADLAFLYGSSLYSQAAAAAAAATWPISCGCPTPVNQSTHPGNQTPPRSPSEGLKRPLTYVLLNKEDTSAQMYTGSATSQHVI